MTEPLCKSCEFYDTLTQTCKERKGNTSFEQLKIHDKEVEACSLWKDGEEKRKQEILDIYKTLKEVLKNYLDLKEEYYTLIALWILGTWCHKLFNTFPYLFLNATKGSGKTRLLKLISALTPNGTLLGSLNEAVMFRTAKNTTFCIDEFESIGSKEKQSLRELLNAGYKKGMKIRRMAKGKVKDEETGKDKESQVVEEFEPYTPIAMANIWGMDEILGDRCLSLILEKSSSYKTKMIEDFLTNPIIKKIKEQLMRMFSVGCVVYDGIKDIEPTWNQFIISYTNYTNNTNNTIYTTYTTTPQPTQLFFEKIYNLGIYGRDLELLFPLFIIAQKIGDDVLDEIIKIGQEIIKTKQEAESYENKDGMFLTFLSNQLGYTSFTPIAKIVSDFKTFLDDVNCNEWLHNEWIGRSLKRMNLILEKRRIARGIEVRINITKAGEKSRMFLK